jgi:hypothetical protein
MYGHYIKAVLLLLLRLLLLLYISRRTGTARIQTVQAIFSCVGGNGSM